MFGSVIGMCILVMSLVANLSIEEDVAENIGQYVSGSEALLCNCSAELRADYGIEFLRKAQDIADVQQRTKIVEYGIRLIETSSVQLEGGHKDETVSMLSAYLKTNPSLTLRRKIAKHLLANYSSADLEKSGDSIEQAFEEWQDISSMIVYGALPSANSSVLVAFAENMRASSSVPTTSAWCDAVAARHGSREAEERLIVYEQSFNETGMAMIEALTSQLGYVNTLSMKEYLAKNIRNEQKIKMTGGGSVPRRNMYIGALLETLRLESSFPIKDIHAGSYYYSDEQLDALERWCTENLNVLYPSTPRKIILAEPHVIPMPSSSNEPGSEGATAPVATD